MKFGLSGCGGGFDGDDPAEILSMSALAEDLGFIGIWINEEHFHQVRVPRRCYSPLILGAAIAARTRRIRIGFSVLLLSLHNSLRLAEDIANLDLLSGGRVDFGISRGNNARYMQAFGVDPIRGSPEHFQESLQFILKCWTGEEFAIDEDKYSTMKTVQQPHPPVYIGTYTEETAAWAAKSGHFLIQHGIQSRRSLKAMLRAFEGAGRDVSKVPVGRFMFVSDSDSAARKVAWPAACKLADFLRRMKMFKNGILDERDLEPERFYSEMVIAGGPHSCVEQLKALSEDMGVNYVNSLASFFGNLSPQQILPSLKATSKDIMPILDH